MARLRTGVAIAGTGRRTLAYGPGLRLTPRRGPEPRPPPSLSPGPPDPRPAAGPLPGYPSARRHTARPTGPPPPTSAPS
eukprot:3936585-Rhodomonas_salina.2